MQSYVTENEYIQCVKELKQRLEEAESRADMLQSQVWDLEFNIEELESELRFKRECNCV